jgi:hypothetical protein
MSPNFLSTNDVATIAGRMHMPCIPLTCIELSPMLPTILSTNDDVTIAGRIQVPCIPLTFIVD